MIINLFSVFDPVVGGLALNWVSLFVLFAFVFLFYFLVGRVLETLVRVVYKGVREGLKGVVYPNYTGLVMLGFGVFLYLALRNYLGLFPFVFTGTAHPVLTLGVGVVY